ncbi:hypothetical protein [Conyzicola nivalis]|uniref:hypothetical protein n=1 Tax=Conyzicola nivalis TaxID=1477021 RepID=UPI0016656793|nr:hypothetical protein [Conyzicola nivalis]
MSNPNASQLIVEITHINSEIVRFREITPDFRWIDVKFFAYSGVGNPKDVLAAVIANPWYNDDYASPSGALPEPSRGLHGPFRLDHITVGSFDKSSARKCRETVRTWAGQLGPLPKELTVKYDSFVAHVLEGASAVFRLTDLDDTARHPWGGQLGVLGFHEFVVISPKSKTIALLVASDD